LHRERRRCLLGRCGCPDRRGAPPGARSLRRRPRAGGAARRGPADSARRGDALVGGSPAAANVSGVATNGRTGEAASRLPLPDAALSRLPSLRLSVRSRWLAGSVALTVVV